MTDKPFAFEPCTPSASVPRPPEAEPSALVTVFVDGLAVSVPEGSTLMMACTAAGRTTPTLCFHETLTPVNACRMCVVELEGARTLVPSCARKAEEGMRIQTDSERVRTSRRLVLELLGSAVDLSTAPAIDGMMQRYDAHPERFGAPAPESTDRDRRHAGHHTPPRVDLAETVAQPPKVDNDLYVRDYAKCILCYKCVQACGTDAQHTFAIAVAGRGFDARISIEGGAPLPDSACVYCGNCIAVCPTGALMSRREYDLRAAGEWREDTQTRTDTVCSYCGVGCTLTLHVQDERIVNVRSPADNEITRGNLCIKGRFGFDFVDPRRR